MALYWAAKAAANGYPAMANVLAERINTVLDIEKKISWVDPFPRVILWALVAALKGYPMLSYVLANIICRVDDISKKISWIDHSPLVLLQATKAAVYGHPIMADVLTFTIYTIKDATKISSWIISCGQLLSWACKAAIQGHPGIANALATKIENMSEDVKEKMIDQDPEIHYYATKAAKLRYSAIDNILSGMLHKSDGNGLNGAGITPQESPSIVNALVTDDLDKVLLADDRSVDDARWYSFHTNNAQEALRQKSDILLGKTATVGDSWREIFRSNGYNLNDFRALSEDCRFDC